MLDVISRLAEGDMRTTGASEAVAKIISHDPKLFDKVFAALHSDAPGLRMRAADALEKASAANHALLAGHKPELLGPIGSIPQKEVQWHVAQMIPRLDLTHAERAKACLLMENYFDTSKSNIVRVFALQTIYDLAKQDPSLQATADIYVDRALKDPAPSLQSRARKLLQKPL